MNFKFTRERHNLLLACLQTWKLCAVWLQDILTDVYAKAVGASFTKWQLDAKLCSCLVSVLHREPDLIERDDNDLYTCTDQKQQW